MDKKTVRIHDGIVGALIVVETILGFQAGAVWFWLPGLVGVLMIVSAFTGFCPVYKIMGLCGFKS